MDDVLQSLSECTIFKDIPRDIISNKVIPLGRVKNFTKGEYIFHFQDVIRDLIIVISGIVHSIYIYENGNYTVLDSAEKGEIVGVDLIFTKSNISPYQSINATDTKIFFIKKSYIYGENSPLQEFQNNIYKKMLTLIANDNIRKRYRLIILSQKGLRDRISTYLSMQSIKHQSRSIKIPFSRSELASFLCVNRSSLSHELSLMKQDGLIDFHKNSFTLLNLSVFPIGNVIYP
ncbi:MAG: hypothetical protein CSB16_02235 [Clostridiales bacterium]|nr:MAG: hypothetical protein CSB16_02235 [Clostridiales bacterium]